jgi:hypothetical protein
VNSYAEHSYGTAGNYAFDAWVDGVRSQFKTMKDPNPKTVEKAMGKANGQHA